MQPSYRSWHGKSERQKSDSSIKKLEYVKYPSTGSVNKTCLSRTPSASTFEGSPKSSLLNSPDGSCSPGLPETGFSFEPKFEDQTYLKQRRNAITDVIPETKTAQDIVNINVKSFLDREPWAGVGLNVSVVSTEYISGEISEEDDINRARLTGVVKTRTFRLPPFITEKDGVTLQPTEKDMIEPYFSEHSENKEYIMETPNDPTINGLSLGGTQDLENFGENLLQLTTLTSKTGADNENMRSHILAAILEKIILNGSLGNDKYSASQSASWNLEFQVEQEKRRKKSLVLSSDNIKHKDFLISQRNSQNPINSGKGSIISDHGFNSESFSSKMSISNNSYNVMREFHANNILSHRNNEMNKGDGSGLVNNELINTTNYPAIQRRVPGVWFDTRRKLWRAQYLENGKRKTKGFSSKHYGGGEAGFLKARQLAIELKKHKTIEAYCSSYPKVSCTTTFGEQAIPNIHRTNPWNSNSGQISVKPEDINTNTPSLAYSLLADSQHFDMDGSRCNSFL